MQQWREGWEDFTRLQKQVKQDAAEVHREGRAMEVEKARWQRELSDARAELADAKVTMLNQGNRIRELERGYSLKPNPAESRLRLEIGELNQQLEAYKQQQQSPTERQFPTALDLLNKLLKRRKISKVREVDVEIILEILGGENDAGLS